MRCTENWQYRIQKIDKIYMSIKHENNEEGHNDQMNLVKDLKGENKHL